MNTYLLSIDKTDDQVASIIRERHTREIRVAEAALDKILHGISDFGVQKQKSDDYLESARLFLVTRSFNSIWAALQLLERGYYQQAMALVRMAMEDRIVALDIENNPATLSALLHGDGKIGRGELALKRMAERVSPKTKVAWDDDYGGLSKFGTHPRVESMQGLITTDSDGRMTLRAGGHYDEVWINFVIYHLLRELAQVFATIAKVTTYAGIDWVTSALPIKEELDSLWRQIDERAREELGEPIGGSERPPFGEATDGESNG